MHQNGYTIETRKTVFQVFETTNDKDTMVQ